MNRPCSMDACPPRLGRRALRHRRRCAFTLVELLIVIAIIGLMMGMLMPALGTVWQTAYMSQCRVRLKDIYTAHSTYRSEKGGDRFATGPEWVERVLPYLEGKASALMCPLGPNVVSVGMDADVKGVRLADIAFEIYSGGGFLYDIPLDSDFIFRFPEGPGRFRFEIEDQRTGGDYTTDAKDIVVVVQFDGGRPTSIYFSPDHSGHGYNFKFKIRDEIIFENYDPEGIGTTLSLDEYGLSLCDYGMSTGSYMVVGREIVMPDPKVFFILDYGKALADYNGDGYDDYWDQFFVLPGEEEAWADKYAAYGSERVTLKDCQALRHFGKANVLFCDGHVETLAADPETAADEQKGKYLREESPLWQYSGR